MRQSNHFTLIYYTLECRDEWHSQAHIFVSKYSYEINGNKTVFLKSHALQILGIGKYHNRHF